jgi:hypothetical protein
MSTPRDPDFDWRIRVRGMTEDEVATKLEKLEAALAAREGDDWVLLERANAAEAALADRVKKLRAADFQIGELQRALATAVRELAECSRLSWEKAKELAEARELLERLHVGNFSKLGDEARAFLTGERP